jgi:hypothetical protein
MPHGTASYRLRKMVLLHLLQKYGENICFKCSEKIEDVNDLSIEHKQPWEGVSVELFWSLDNIAFSHLRCNTPHRYVGGGVSKRKVGPEGTAWCVGRRGYRDAGDFSRNRSRWNGLQNYCNDCLKKTNAPYGT